MKTIAVFEAIFLVRYKNYDFKTAVDGCGVLSKEST